MVGVEVDPMTAAVAARLYPSAQIRNEGFETTRVPENSFAAVVGNVPFGRYVLTDPAHNPQRLTIHNHFIAKSLALTAPGGYVALLTSRYTLDSTKPAARAAIAELGDLIGAVRLPSTALHRLAGTQVVTDLLILRRHQPGTAPTEPWITTSAFVDEDDLAHPDVPINDYYQAHPDHVLGTMTLGHGLNGSTTLVVDGPAGTELAQRLRHRLTTIVDAALAGDRGLTATPADLTVVSEATFDPGLITAADRAPDVALDTLRYNAETDGIESWTGHHWQAKKTPKTRLAETRELIALRDTATSLITAQRDGRPQPERDQLRGHLNTLYDNYVRRHGPVNRYTLVHAKDITAAQHDAIVASSDATWRAEHGEPNHPYDGPVPLELAERWDAQAWQSADPYKRRLHLDGGMRDDPGWAVVAALEIFDEDTGQARKAPIFATDLLSPSAAAVTADTPEDALAMSLDRNLRVDIDYIATLLDVAVADARALLEGLVYPSLEDPDELIPAAAALSGNVRTKHERAVLAAEHNPVYARYAAALAAVVPSERTAEQIKVRPGAPWVDARYVAQFVQETFGVNGVAAEHLAGRWSVEAPKYQRHGRLVTETWGLDRDKCDAISLLDAICNSRSIVVTADDGTLDTPATFAAQAKCDKITDEFGKWIFADAQRAETLVAEHNRRFNSLRAPRYDGSKLRLPGLSDHFTPHFYQRNAVARIVAEPTTLLDHVVGAGKTGTMLMAAMELRRLGLVRQPWIVVPNHIVEQVGRESGQWYPAAKVLLGSAATTAEGRRRFIAQSAASDWDMVIVGESAFTRIAVNHATRVDYIEDQLATLRAQLQTAESDKTKKRIELAVKQAADRLERLTTQTRKDSGIGFENSGCDYLFIDEAHLYKNKSRVCNIKELSCTSSSMRAEDLTLKLRILRQRRRDEALAAGTPADQVVERVATFATGTPIANSLGELWVMQSYLRPDLLRAAGVEDLGDWGAAFTSTVTRVEVNTTGTRLRPVTRVGKFRNMADLAALSAAFTDVITRDQVPATLPTLATGARQIVSLVPEVEVSDFIADLGYRADHFDSRRPDRDNELKVGNDGRNVSLDPRLAHLPAPANSRAVAVAERAMTVHRASADRIYHDPRTGAPMPTPGALQIMFCDRGTPSSDPEQFTVYQAIKDELIARGMPAAAIRFVHEARKPAERKALFAACIRGDVSVLIGSTEKMGTGTNIQDRARALHHVDVPWRPADLAQREGRVLRQGNQNTEVDIFNYVTEGTYDTVMWQKVQAKELFINQYRHNAVLDDEVEDLESGDLGAAAAEIKAIATGDPRYVRQVELEDAVKRLSALQRAHHDASRQRDWTVSQLERSIPNREHDLAQLAPIARHAEQRAADETPVRITVDGSAHTDRAHLAAGVAAACRHAYAAGKDHGATQFNATGIAVDGVDVLAARSLMDDALLLRLAVPSRTTELTSAELAATAIDIGGPKAHGLIRRLENLYTTLPAHERSLRAELARDTARLDDLLANPPAPFDGADTLDATKAELAALTLELRLAADSPEAKAKAAAAVQRMNDRGRRPGWSLLLNPTPAVLAETGLPTADALRRLIDARERIALDKHHGRHIDSPVHGLD